MHLCKHLLGISRVLSKAGKVYSMFADSNRNVIIRFYEVAQQPYSHINRITGYVKVKNFIQIIDVLDLDANPRSSKTGAVVNGIHESMAENADIFPFMTKGVLLAASDYESLDRGRYRVFFNDPDTEGILDGGHNTLAIGLYILRKAKDAWNNFGDETASFATPTDKDIKHINTWSDFKEAWNTYRDLIDWYQIALRKSDSDTSETETPLDVLIPVELIVPSDPTNPIILEDFKLDLLEICSARNNNVQLTTSAKANKHGYFDILKSLLAKEDSKLAADIEWKTNDAGSIKPQDIITLCWIPLALVPDIANGEIKDDNDKAIDPPSPVSLYSGKESAMTKFERLMSSNSVTEHNNAQGGLKNLSVASALKIAAQLPALYDQIYRDFPEAYNQNGGKYGGIKAVSAVNQGHAAKTTPYGKRPVEKASPQGYIAPLVYGLQALMEVKNINGVDTIVWRNGIDPSDWLSKNLKNIAKRYTVVMSAYNYDPQKIGKAAGVYENALDNYKLSLAGL